MKRVPRRIFTEEFKKEAVSLFKQQDLTLAEVTYADFQRVRSFVKCNETEEYDGEVTQNALQSRI